MLGKEKCRMLRSIREQIARENDIALITSECTFQGKCRGTCPKCEAELKYLEAELAKRSAQRKRIALAGISIGTILALSGCSVVEDIAEAIESKLHPTDEPITQLMGDVPAYEVLDGEIVCEEREDA